MITLLADPEITGIPVCDNGEPLVDLTALGLPFEGADPSGALVRAGVAERLMRADAALPGGHRLLIREAYRAASEQLRIIAGYSETLRRRQPELDELALRRLSSRFVAPIEVAPHVAGAAVDLTLADTAGNPLWMGTPIDATPEESANACLFDAENIDALARSHRVLLGSVLSAAGLVNYPTEWWHWSYGDRYWAFSTGAEHAIYGAIADEAAA